MVDQCNVVTDFFHGSHVVGREDDGVSLIFQFQNFPFQQFSIDRIESGERFVEDQQLIQGGYVPCYKAATLYGDTHNGHHICGPSDGYSVDSRRRGQDRTSGAIDHCLIYDPSGKTEVKVFDCIMESYTVGITDHYPNLIDVRL
jgi:hypothetical protein